MRIIPGILRRLFRREAAPREDGILEELWNPDRLDAGSGRFVEEGGKDWSSAYAGGRLELELRRESLIAWSEAAGHVYDDFLAEAGLDFPPGPGYEAAGLLFRYVDERNFYLLLLSTRGYYRLDSVFNGSPRALIAWTEIPDRLEGPRAPATLRLIARGSRFSIMVDGAWVGEAEDETARSGSLAFAAQVFDEAGRAGIPGPRRFALSSFLVESRPVEVEALYLRLARMEVPATAARRALAATFLAMGLFVPAAVQLRRIEKSRPLDQGELLLSAEIKLRLELLDEAAADLDRALALGPDHEEALLEKANLLYRRGRYVELRDFAEALPEALKRNARVALLIGHARFNLGDYPGAARAYAEANAGEEGQPLLRMNEARAWEQAGRPVEAFEAWLAAARGFFSAEARDELDLALARLEVLAPQRPELDEIRARALFLAGDHEAAGRLIDRRLASGSSDSALAYIGGLIARGRGDRRGALAYFERALELEPAAALYAWRRAETLQFLGRPEAGTAVEEALAAHPEDGWTQNLAGQASLAKARTELETEGLVPGLVGGPAAENLALARARLEGAVRALPGRAEPLMNLAELASLEGRGEEALALLRGLEGRSEARNQAGNILSRMGRARALAGESAEAEAFYQRAEREYLQAIELEGGRQDYHENLAALLMELERWSDAETRIRRALELGGAARSYLLAGNLASVLGDLPRAETAYRVGLEGGPGDPALLMALGRLLLSLRRWERARETVDRLLPDNPVLAERLRSELEQASTEGLSCAGCGRQWRVPRELPAQSAAHIRGMPPDEAPAGSCPSCGKIFCISCRKASVTDNRFSCPDCGDNLKLSDNRLRYLVREALSGQAKAD